MLSGVRNMVILKHLKKIQALLSSITALIGNQDFVCVRVCVWVFQFVRENIYESSHLSNQTEGWRGRGDKTQPACWRAFRIASDQATFLKGPICKRSLFLSLNPNSSSTYTLGFPTA